MPVSPSPTSAERLALADQLAELFPLIKKQFAAGIPEHVREEFANATAHQLEVVCQLGAMGDGITMNDLARSQNCAMSTATALADRLVRHGLAERIDDANDRRVVRIVPTARARDLAADFRAARRAGLLSILNVLSDEDLHHLVRLLRTIARAEEPANV